MRITNFTGINLALAVWLVHDEYDYIDEANYISATSLLKPTRQLVLVNRIPPTDREADVEDFTARALGHAIHDSMEKAWVQGFRTNMKKLGYPAEVIENIRINPTLAEVEGSNSLIPIWIEQREFRKIEVDGIEYKIGGKSDMIADWILHDNKSTSAWAWKFGGRDEDHIRQLSIYRWLNPRKVREDYAKINYIFTDWAKMQARSDPKYPQKRVEEKVLQLLSLDETEAFIRERLRAYRRHFNDPDEKIPQCTDKELWRSDPVYKYYSDPVKAQEGGRATKNFDSLAEANVFRNDKGKGVVVTIPGEPKACSYCPAFDGCKQKDAYFT